MSETWRQWKPSRVPSTKLAVEDRGERREGARRRRATRASSMNATYPFKSVFILTVELSPYSNSFVTWFLCRQTSHMRAGNRYQINGTNISCSLLRQVRHNWTRHVQIKGTRFQKKNFLKKRTDKRKWATWIRPPPDIIGFCCRILPSLPARNPSSPSTAFIDLFSFYYASFSFLKLHKMARKPTV